MTTPAGNDDGIAKADRWSGVPTGWRAVTGQEMEVTGSRVVDSMQAASTVDGIKGLERAVAPESSHAVRLLELWPTGTGSAFDASDLMVVRLCGHDVSLETCLAIAGDDGAHVRTIARHLRAVPNDRGACMADASTLLAMDSLWSALFEALRAGGADLADATAAAHILCARKRPQLFPASATIAESRTDAEDARHSAWQLHRFLDGDALIRGTVRSLVLAAKTCDRGLGRKLSGMWTVPLVELCATVGEQAGY